MKRTKPNIVSKVTPARTYYHTLFMKAVHIIVSIGFAVVLNSPAQFTNPDVSLASTQSPQEWELIRSVTNSFGGTEEFVLIPTAKIHDLSNYQSAANAIAGTRRACMISFWTDRKQIPISARIPIANLQTMTATYERSPSYEKPYLRLAGWLYPSIEAATNANAFFMPGIKMPEVDVATNGTSKH